MHNINKESPAVFAGALAAYEFYAALKVIARAYRGGELDVQLNKILASYRESLEATALELERWERGEYMGEIA